MKKWITYNIILIFDLSLSFFRKWTNFGRISAIYFQFKPKFFLWLDRLLNLNKLNNFWLVNNYDIIQLKLVIGIRGYRLDRRRQHNGFIGILLLEVLVLIDNLLVKFLIIHFRVLHILIGLLDYGVFGGVSQHHLANGSIWFRFWK